LEFHLEDVIISLINIVVLFFLLRLILWKHVIRFLAERAKHVQDIIDDAEQQRIDAEALRDEYLDKIDKIDDYKKQMILEGRQKASKESELIMNEAREKANQLLNEAENRIEEEKELALEEIQVDVTQLATEMAARILKREVSPQDNINIVEDFFN